MTRNYYLFTHSGTHRPALLLLGFDLHSMGLCVAGTENSFPYFLHAVYTGRIRKVLPQNSTRSFANKTTLWKLLCSNHENWNTLKPSNCERKIWPTMA